MIGSESHTRSVSCVICRNGASRHDDQVTMMLHKSIFPSSLDFRRIKNKIDIFGHLLTQVLNQLGESLDL